MELFSSLNLTEPYLQELARRALAPKSSKIRSHDSPFHECMIYVKAILFMFKVIPFSILRKAIKLALAGHALTILKSLCVGPTRIYADACEGFLLLSTIFFF